MNVAFYAPLKSPASPVPSGDRLIARMLMQALEAGGHDVRIMSQLRSFDRDGDGVRQARIARIGAWQKARLVRRLAASDWHPDVWLTYHLYHKAPDWIGPGVAQALGIPYCVVEASYAPAQAAGKWAAGHAAVAAALAAAALVVSINPKDVGGIRPLVGPKTRIISVAPFIDGAMLRAARSQRLQHRAELATSLELDPDQPWLIAVGMLRNGDKASSYEVLACAASMLAERRWLLIIVGDGPARARIEEQFAGLGQRVRFVGEQRDEAVAGLLAASDILVWPAVNEAIGMVFIESAMAGLPVVGAQRPGIAAVVDDGETGLLVPEWDAAAFAAATARLLDDVALRHAMGKAAAAKAAAQYDLATAGKLVCRELEALVR